VVDGSVSDRPPSFPDAPGAPQDASSGDLRPPTCNVTIEAVEPTRLRDLPAGPAARLRVTARAEGALAPAKPAWRWTVLYEQRDTVQTMTKGGDPATIEFAIEKVGSYSISATASPACASTAYATAVPSSQAFASFWIRATAPPDRSLPPVDLQVAASSAMPSAHIDFPSGFPVTVDPRDQSGALPAYYLQIVGRRSTTRLERYIENSPVGFRAFLDPNVSYDMLIVPDGAASDTAPRAFLAITPMTFPSSLQQVFSRGTRVFGHVRTATGALEGARVRLRAGLLPSTLRTTDAVGAFELRARPGRFEVRVLPPPDSGLPEARVDEFHGVDIPSPEPDALPLDFTYAALATTRLDLTITLPDGGAPGRMLNVELESDARDLADVGGFKLADGSRLAARGTLRVRKAATPGGLLTFTDVPRARYRATVLTEGIAGVAVTTVDLDLTGGTGPVTARMLPLQPKTRVLGRLLPASQASGLKVMALDVGIDGNAAASAGDPVLVGTDGRFELPADPDHIYRLFVEPPPDRSLPRIPLQGRRALLTADTVDYTLPRRLGLNGTVTSGGLPLAGAVVQVFCINVAPDCVDPSAPNLETTRPLDETVSAGDGSYQLSLPDPGR
jgi:hypothetical protein